MKEHELRNILELKDQMVRQEYEMVRQLQQEQQSLSHDLKNHLLVMDTLLKEGKYQEARNYIGQLGIPLERLAPSIWTGTSTLDVLLNHTRNRCIQSHITFTVQADAVDLRPMEDQDICNLFANLLDNAYEAAHSMPDGQGWILFKMRKGPRGNALLRYFQLIARTSPCQKRRPDLMQTGWTASRPWT